MTHDHHSHGRVTLGGKLSAVLVAAGSSVGLGNIWRFPYIAGDNGGGAFLVIYIACVLLLGLPLMLAEFSVGRAARCNAVGAYRALNPKWSLLGYNGVLAAFLILGFYFVVSGWTAEYMVHSITGEFAHYTSAAEYQGPSSASSPTRGGRCSTPCSSPWPRMLSSPSAYRRASSVRPSC